MPETQRLIYLWLEQGHAAGWRWVMLMAALHLRAPSHVSSATPNCASSCSCEMFITNASQQSKLALTSQQSETLFLLLFAWLLPLFSKFLVPTYSFSSQDSKQASEVSVLVLKCKGWDQREARVWLKLVAMAQLTEESSNDNFTVCSGFPQV